MDCGSVSSYNNINNIENTPFLEVILSRERFFRFNMQLNTVYFTHHPQKFSHLRVFISKKVDYLYHCRVFKHLDYIVKSIS